LQDNGVRHFSGKPLSWTKAVPVSRMSPTQCTGMSLRRNLLLARGFH
jgi:hypothetical protein